MFKVVAAGSAGLGIDAAPVPGRAQFILTTRQAY